MNPLWIGWLHMHGYIVDLELLRRLSRAQSASAPRHDRNGKRVNPTPLQKSLSTRRRCLGIGDDAVHEQ